LLALRGIGQDDGPFDRSDAGFRQAVDHSVDLKRARRTRESTGSAGDGQRFFDRHLVGIRCGRARTRKAAETTLYAKNLSPLRRVMFKPFSPGRHPKPTG
jgi:hypothetical protein